MATGVVGSRGSIGRLLIVMMDHSSTESCKERGRGDSSFTGVEGDAKSCPHAGSPSERLISLLARVGLCCTFTWWCSLSSTHASTIVYHMRIGETFSIAQQVHVQPSMVQRVLPCVMFAKSQPHSRRVRESLWTRDSISPEMTRERILPHFWASRIAEWLSEPARSLRKRRESDLSQGSAVIDEAFARQSQMILVTLHPRHMHDLIDVFRGPPTLQLSTTNSTSSRDTIIACNRNDANKQGVEESQRIVALRLGIDPGRSDAENRQLCTLRCEGTEVQ